MRPLKGANFADRRVRPVFLIVLGMSLLVPLTSGRSQTSYTYTAETENPTRKKGDATAGALKWECVGSRCTIVGSWPALGVGSCQALARVVGRIKTFGRPGAALDASQLSQCNATPSGGVVVGPVGAPTARLGFCDDCDGDGHHSPTAPLITRRNAAGDDIIVSSPGDDCDDADPNRYPGNTEHCDPAGHDEDCNPITVGDKDEDGDGHIDENCRNPSGETLPIAGDDCDDTKPGVHPGVPELCNGLDDDCDGSVDAADDLEAGMKIWVREDRDRDGFGRSGSEVRHICLIGDMRGSAINDYDCDDANPRRHPGAGCP